MYVLIILCVTILAALLCFVLPGKNSNASNIIGLLVTITGVVFSVLILQELSVIGKSFDGNGNSNNINFDMPWLQDFGARFSLFVSPIGALLCLLTSICFVLIFLSTHNKSIDNNNKFNGLMLLSMAGLIGVFTAHDALLFYTFWELALIPVYFLCSSWGDVNRVAVSFKFFIYTFVGSLIMLVALIYMYNKTPTHSFAWDSFMQLKEVLNTNEQIGLFAMLFIAFAIKMPIFPFHTWQPDTYEQTYTPVTMVLSAVMVKMGLFAVITWLIPILPQGTLRWQNVIIILCLIGIVYASILAIIQKDAKRIIAYSSIAHVGLMCIAIFSATTMGYQGAFMQIFTHGINIIGMWLLLYFVENKLQTRNISEMGGLAGLNQSFVIFLVIITLANIALPLTNAFVGEFMMFNGLFNSNVAHPITYTVIAGLGVILSAVYSLNLVQKVAFGTSNFTPKDNSFYKFSAAEFLALSIVVILILVFGFYPQAILNVIN
jgi:NADH-quinone oxidoreductase subunit M